MTRKHFELIAKIVKNIDNPMTRRNVAVDFAHALRGENPNFDICRFVKACDCSAPTDGDKVTF